MKFIKCLPALLGIVLQTIYSCSDDKPVESEQKAIFSEMDYTFDADVKSVYDAWANPEIFAEWIHPSGKGFHILPWDERDPAGLRWIISTEDGKNIYGRINIKANVPNRHLMYTTHFCDRNWQFAKAPFSDTYPDSLLTTIIFEAIDGRTRVNVRWDVLGKATKQETNTFFMMEGMLKGGYGAAFKKLKLLLKEGS